MISLYNVCRVDCYWDQQRLNPRILSTAQEERIAAQMRQFAGVKYDASVPEADLEAAFGLRCRSA